MVDALNSKDTNAVSKTKAARPWLLVIFIRQLVNNYNMVKQIPRIYKYKIIL